MKTTPTIRAHVRAAVRFRGFTLLEVMITIAIVAVLMGLGVPGMRAFIENRYASSQAETLAGELRKAQIEAIKRNNVVELVMATTTVVPTPTFDPSAVTLTFGGNAISSPVVNLLARVAGANTVAGHVSSVSAGDDTSSASGVTHARVAGVAGIGFNSFGKALYTLNTSNAQTSVSGNTVFIVTNPFYTAPDARRRCVFVSPGGAVKVCDPALPSGVGASCRPALTTTECP